MNNVLTHHEKSLLDDTASKLSEYGYKTVDIYISKKDEEDETGLWWLRVKKIEQHDIE